MKTKEQKVRTSANSSVKSNTKDNNKRSRYVAPRVIKTAKGEISLTRSQRKALYKEHRLQKQLESLRLKRERKLQGKLLTKDASSGSPSKELSPKRAAYAEFKRVWRLAARVKRLIGAFKTQDRVSSTSAKKLTKELTAVQKNHNSKEGFEIVKTVLAEMAHV